MRGDRYLNLLLFLVLNDPWSFIILLCRVPGALIRFLSRINSLKRLILLGGFLSLGVHRYARSAIAARLPTQRAGWNVSRGASRIHSGLVTPAIIGYTCSPTWIRRADSRRWENLLSGLHRNHGRDDGNPTGAFLALIDRPVPHPVPNVLVR